MPGDYQLVPLSNGAVTLLSLSYGEKMHPGLGPQAEAELLYVRQLRICERLRNHPGEFVIWDVGLGAAANAIAALRAAREIPGRLRIVSFDNTAEPLEFALQNAAALGYVTGYEKQIAELFRRRRVEFQNGELQADWEFHFGDFPALLANSKFKTSSAARHFLRRLLARQKSRDVDAVGVSKLVSRARPAAAVRADDVFAQHDDSRHAAAGRIFRRRWPCHRREGGNDDCGE